MKHAVYDYTVEKDFVCVVDRDLGMSVTNDAEHVVADLARVLRLERLRVICRDSDGTWDELLVKDGRFAGFRILGARSKEQAKALAEHPGPRQVPR